MESLILHKTEETPDVVLDAEKGIFQFKETSWPEDATKFYEPIFQWFEEYFQNPNAETVIEFYFKYFNTASQKQIARLMTIVEKYADKHSITIKWFYEKDDADMYKAGVRYAKILKIKFELVEVDEM